MRIIKPDTHEPDPKQINDPRTTRLFFKADRNANFYMYGAIAWPKEIITDKKKITYPGFALMAGQILEGNREIRIFEEQEFTTIDNRLLPDGNIKTWKDGSPRYGLAEFANGCYKRYGCRKFFYDHRQEEVYQLYLRQMIESRKENRLQQPIAPHSLQPVHETGDLVLSKYMGENRLVVDTHSKLNDMARSPDKLENNGMLALKCLLVGYEHNPWIDLVMTRRAGGYG